MKFKDFRIQEIHRDYFEFSIAEILDFTKFARKYLAKHNVQILRNHQIRVTCKSKVTERVDALIATLLRIPICLGGVTRISRPSILNRPPDGMRDSQYRNLFKSHCNRYLN